MAEILHRIDLIQDEAIRKKIHSSLGVLRRTFALYPLPNIAFSFNGGKDSTVLLHLLRAALSQTKQLGCTVKSHISTSQPLPAVSADHPAAHTAVDNCSRHSLDTHGGVDVAVGLGGIRSFFFVRTDDFDEVKAFVRHKDRKFGLNVDYITEPEFKAGLEAYIQRTGVQAIVLGTRRGDPNAGNQDVFCPSSEGWPAFMRVNPILDWNYHEVWVFLRAVGAGYCSLYEQGYTSLGNTANTVPNSALQQADGTFAPAHALTDGSLERAGRQGSAKPPPSSHSPYLAPGNSVMAVAHAAAVAVKAVLKPMQSTTAPTDSVGAARTATTDAEDDAEAAKQSAGLSANPNAAAATATCSEAFAANPAAEADALLSRKSFRSTSELLKDAEIDVVSETYVGGFQATASDWAAAAAAAEPALLLHPPTVHSVFRSTGAARTAAALAGGASAASTNLVGGAAGGVAEKTGSLPAAALADQAQMRTAALVVIGDELLSGKVEDSNTPFLCRELRLLGWTVTRAVLVPDNVDAIALEVRALSASMDVVLTTGGVGPTLDDVTMAAIAQALEQPLIRNPDFVRRLTNYFGAAATEAHFKMAESPAECTLIDYALDDGAASPFPLVRCRNIYVLPGVPHLLRQKWKAIRALLQPDGSVGLPPFRNTVLRLSARDEAKIAPALDAIAADYPTVQLGSYPVTDQHDSAELLLTLDSKDKVSLEGATTALVALLPSGSVIAREADVTLLSPRISHASCTSYGSGGRSMDGSGGHRLSV